MKFSQSLFPYTLKLFYCLNLGVSHIVINLEKKCVKLLENHKFEAIFFIKLNLSSDWQYEAQNMSCHFSPLEREMPLCHRFGVCNTVHLYPCR